MPLDVQGPRCAPPLSCGWVAGGKQNQEGMMAKAFVVDDSRAVRMILSKILTGLGFEVSHASNGKEALELIEAEQAPVQLVLVDWNMPEMNGLDLVKCLRRHQEFESMVIVMVTTESEMDHMLAALEAGANEYVMKPFTREILVEKLQLAGVQL
jgi:two-component system chemotaxis response regulator CheY